MPAGYLQMTLSQRLGVVEIVTPRHINQLPSSSIEAYKCTFFPHTIRDWNDLPDCLFSTAEMSGDYVYKFASLVRTRD